MKRPATVAVATGLSLGLTNSLSNVFGSPFSPHSLSSDGVLPLEVLAAVMGTTWAWALTAFVAGLLTRQVRVGPVAGAASLLVADVTYYLSDSLSGYAPSSAIEALLWGVLALPTGLGMGLLGALASLRRSWSFLPGLAAPATVALLAGRTGSDHIQPWPTVITQAVVVALAIAVGVSWTRTRRRATPAQATAVDGR